MQTPSLNILLLTSHDSVAEELAGWLHADGHTVTRADSLPEARILCELMPFSLLIIDLDGLPEGDTGVRHLLLSPGAPHESRPVIALAAPTTPDKPARPARLPGFAAHLTKPLSAPIVRTAIAASGAIRHSGGNGATAS